MVGRSTEPQARHTQNMPRLAWFEQPMPPWLYREDPKPFESGARIENVEPYPQRQPEIHEPKQQH